MVEFGVRALQVILFEQVTNENLVFCMVSFP